MAAKAKEAKAQLDCENSVDALDTLVWTRLSGEATHISHSNQASPMFINFWRKYKIYISIYKMV